MLCKPRIPFQTAAKVKGLRPRDFPPRPYANSRGLDARLKRSPRRLGGAPGRFLPPRLLQEQRRLRVVAYLRRDRASSIIRAAASLSSTSKTTFL